MFKLRRCKFQYISIPVLGIRYPKSITRLTVGVCFGPIILIREDYWDDKSTWLHELEHVKQTLVNGFLLHFLMYYFSSTYRCNCEVQAYASELVEVENNIDRSLSLNRFASILSTNYRLRLSQFQIAQKLEFAVQSRQKLKIK
jgi:hypothetical protein